MDVEFYKSYKFCIYMGDYVVLSFHLLMQCISSIDLGMLNHPCDVRMDPT